MTLMLDHIQVVVQKCECPLLNAFGQWLYYSLSEQTGSCYPVSDWRGRGEGRNLVTNSKMSRVM